MKNCGIGVQMDGHRRAEKEIEGESGCGRGRFQGCVWGDGGSDGGRDGGSGCHFELCVMQTNAGQLHYGRGSIM